MIGALLSNGPANVLRAQTAAEEQEAGSPESRSAQRGGVSVRESLGSARTAAAEIGHGLPLTADAVLALQETEKSANERQPAFKPAGQAPGEGGKAEDNPAVSNGDASSNSAADEEDKDGDGLNEAEEKQVEKLAQRDREVRAHEQAHARVGGAYASAPTYTFQQGPDGKRYAVGGEVQIDTAKEKSPEATIRKMQIVIRAATAPAEPSSQDLKVAQQARSQLAEAQAELRQQKAEELNGDDASEELGLGKTSEDGGNSDAARPEDGDASMALSVSNPAGGEADQSISNGLAVSAYETAIERSKAVTDALFQALTA